MHDTLSRTDFPMDPEILARQIDIPLDDWPGNCHAVACAVRDLVPVKGMRIARGHWIGRVSRSSVYHQGGIQQHSWLLAADGRILDPTRWAITSPKTPFIYLGPCDHYDEGGRYTAARTGPGFPGRGPDFSRQISTLTAADRADLARLAGYSDPAKASDHALSEDILRKARLDPDEITACADLYRLIDRAGLKSVIPIDSWTRVMDRASLFCRETANRHFTLTEMNRPTPMGVVCDLLVKFCLIENNPFLEHHLDEHGITLDAHNDALTMFEKWTMAPDFLPSSDQFIIGLALTDLLGRGLGNMLRVKRYAASLGYPGDALGDAMNEIAAAFGLCSFWW